MAAIKKHHSLIRAEKVLSAANAIGFSKVAAERFGAKTWDNGREQGLCLEALLFPEGGGVRKLRVFVAEARSSDETVVCIDESESPGRGPSDEAWDEGRRYFRYDDIQGAARFVVGSVERLVKKYHAEEAA